MAKINKLHYYLYQIFANPILSANSFGLGKQLTYKTMVAISENSPAECPFAMTTLKYGIMNLTQF